MVGSIRPSRALAVRSLQYISRNFRFFSGFSPLAFALPSSAGAPSGRGPPNIFWKKGKEGAPPGENPSSALPSSSAIASISDIWDSICSISSSLMPNFSSISLTGLMPSSFAQDRQKPSFLLSCPSVRVTNTTAGRFLHFEHNIIRQLPFLGCLGYRRATGDGQEHLQISQKGHQHTRPGHTHQYPTQGGKVIRAQHQN